MNFRRLELKHQVFGLLGAGALALIAFQNCAPVGFESEVEKVGSSGIVYVDPIDPNTPYTPTTPEEEIVSKACKTGQVHSQTATINFPRPLKTYSNSRCDWNNNGNGGRVNDHFMARLEQTQTISVPAGAKICDIQFSSPKQEWLYDDHVFVTMNDVLLASSHPIHDVLKQESGLSIFEWSKIYNQKWMQIPANVWCEGMDSGLSSCAWPASQTPGDIQLDFAPQLFQKIVARDLSRNTHVFKFVTTGDNDPDVDCDHSALNFDVQITYAY
ncbi:MAG: hypothetical protein V4760_08715 [Bdellovibrionota bacterium]